MGMLTRLFIVGLTLAAALVISKKADAVRKQHKKLKRQQKRMRQQNYS